MAAAALLGIGVVSIAVGCLAAIRPAAPEIVASAFTPPPSRLYCGTLIDSSPPINPSLATKTFAAPADQARWQEALETADSSCQSARRTRTIAVVVGAVLVVLGLLVLLRVVRSTRAEHREGAAAGSGPGPGNRIG